MSPRTRWRIGVYAPAVMLATLTAPPLLMGESPLAGLTVLCSAVVVWFYARSLRDRYKSGWHDGRVDLTRELMGDPDVHATGLAPEPWTPRPVAGVVVRRHDHGGDAPPPTDRA